MTTPFVAILMGSDSDLPVMKATLDTLASFGVPYEVRISSAHRTPAATAEYVADADRRGCARFNAAAGPAAPLAGAVAPPPPPPTRPRHKKKGGNLTFGSVLGRDSHQPRPRPLLQNEKGTNALFRR